MEDLELYQKQKENKNLESGEFLEETQKTSLTLRKLKVQDKFLQKRLAKNQIISNDVLLSVGDRDCSEYTITEDKINLSDELKNKRFNSLDELFDFVNYLFSLKSENELKLGILYVFSASKTNEQSLQKKFLEKKMNEILFSILQNTNNKSMIYQIIAIFINISYIENSEITSALTSVPFLHLYNKIFKENIKDKVICDNLIQLFGNLVIENNEIQNLFYQSNLVDMIINLLNGDNDENSLYFIIWFLACFAKDIQRNYFFKDKLDFLVKLQNVFFTFMKYDRLLSITLIGLTNFSEMEDKKLIIDNFINNDEFFKILTGLSSNNYTYANQIICNLASINSDYDLKLINKENVLNYISKGLDNDFISNKAQAMWIISNLLTNEEQNIIKIFIDKGLIKKIICIIKDINPLLISSGLQCLNVLIENSSYDVAEQLIKNGIVDGYIEVLTKNLDPESADLVLKGIYLMLSIDKKYKFDKYKNNYEFKGFINYLNDKGCKELLEKIGMNNKNNKISEKANNLINLFFSDENDMNIS